METQQIEKASLFKITQDRLDLERLIFELEGELTPEVESALEIGQEQISQKGEGYIYVLEQLQAQIDLNKRYADQAAVNMKRAAKAQDRLKSALLMAAQTFGEFEAGIHKIGIRKSQRVEILETEKVPNSFKTIKMSESIDKVAIKKAFKDGETVPGAEIIECDNLKIA